MTTVDTPPTPAEQTAVLPAAASTPGGWFADPRRAAWAAGLAPVLAALLALAVSDWSAHRVKDLAGARVDESESLRLATRLRPPTPGTPTPALQPGEELAGGTLARIEGAARGLGGGFPLLTTSGAGATAAPARAATGPGADAGSVEVRLEGLTLGDTLTLLDRLAVLSPPLLARRLTLDPFGAPEGEAWAVSLTVSAGEP